MTTCHVIPQREAGRWRDRPVTAEDSPSSLPSFQHIYFLLLTALFSARVGKPVMIITEFMENGSLDTFLKVSRGTTALVCLPRPEEKHFAAEAIAF